MKKLSKLEIKERLLDKEFEPINMIRHDNLTRRRTIAWVNGEELSEFMN